MAMAAAPGPRGKVLSDIDEQILMCAICMERFKSPKILPCYHTFCEPCLKEWVKTNNGQLICPTCKELHPLPSGDVKAITNNRFMNDLLQLVSDTTPETEQSVCEGCDSEAKHWCTDCGQFFCDECIRAHRVVRSLKDHKVMTVEEYNEKMSSQHFRMIQPRFCESHPSTQLEFYCDTCQLPTCMKCSIVKHKAPQHDIISIESALEKYMPTMKQYTKTVEQKVIALKQTKNKALNTGKDYKEKKTVAESRIKNLSKKVINKVKKQEAKLLAEVNEMYAPNCKQIDSKIETLEHKIVNAESMQSYMNHLLTFGGPVDIMSAKKEMEQRLGQCDLHDPNDDDLENGLVFQENPRCLQVVLGCVVNGKVFSTLNTSNSKPSPQGAVFKSLSASSSETTDLPRKGKDPQDNDCAICLDKIKKSKELPCKHKFCKACIDKSEKRRGPSCPVCKQAFGLITGNMPNGTMRDRVDRFCHLPGYPQCGTIVIDYDFPFGTQGKEHPNPGKYYFGTTRTAYLPDNSEGREVLKLLKIAFERRLTFTVGTSMTTGATDAVTCNEIHHKTSLYSGPFGYPDPDYLNRVKEELAAKGVK